MAAGRINRTHPELQDGEVFLTNASDDQSARAIGDEIDDRSDWEAVGWKTKRRGEVAYDIHGRPIPGMFPIFVQRGELIGGGIDPDSLN